MWCGVTSGMKVCRHLLEPDMQLDLVNLWHLQASSLDPLKLVDAKI
jgi:hypothetical protein